MIYWLSGAYGVGKSTVAERLKSKLPAAHIFDAEAVGNAVRDNYPEECRHSVIFEGYPLWREMNFRLLREISESYRGDVIVPMTLVLGVSYDEIIKKLRDCGVFVRYIILDADHGTIRERILSRGEGEDCWCMKNIDTCLAALENDARAEHIDTRCKTPDEIADVILSGSKL